MFRKTKKSRVIGRAVSSTIEPLERRMLLTVGCTFSGGPMIVTGDASANNITFSFDTGTQTITANNNGSPINTACTGRSPGSVTINAGDEADTIDASGLNPINTPVLALGQDGDDTIIGTSSGDTIKGGRGNDSLYGASGNDSVFGDDPGDDEQTGNDIVLGGVGDDTLFGGPGNDTVGATAGNTESGNDSLVGGPGNDSVSGGPNNDSLWGDSANDTTFGGADTISGGTGTDEVDYEGRSEDMYISSDDTDANDGATDGWKAITSASRTSNVVTITASNSLSAGNTVLIIGVVPNSFNGIYTVASATSTSFTYSKSGTNQSAKHVGSFAVSLEHDRVASDIETLCAGDGDDYVIGNDLDNLIKGQEGNDTLRGGSSLDTIQGDGADTMQGDDGDDDWVDYGNRVVNLKISLNASTDDGQNDGTEGDDANVENILSGTGNDTIILDSSGNIVIANDGNDSVSNGGGSDLIFGDAGNDSINAGTGNDTIWGDSPGDTVYVGQDTIFGGDGTDEVRYTGRTNAHSITLKNNLADDGEVSAWGILSALGRASNVVTVTTSSSHGLSVGNTVIIIGTISDSFNGTFTVASVPNSTTFTFSQTASNEAATRAGKFAKALEKDTVHDDVENVSSGEGNDWLDGNIAANSLNGAGGNDTLRGRDAGDTMVGGSGSDWVDYAERISTDGVHIRMDDNTANSGSNGSEGDIIDTIENAVGGAGQDSIVGNASANFIYGGGNGDTIQGGGAGDTLLGESGDDSLGGDDGNDSLVGGDGADTLGGDADNDSLFGERGGDSLAGGAGDDQLTPGMDTTEGSGAYSDTLDGGSGTDFADYSMRVDNLLMHLDDNLANDGSSGEGDSFVQDTIEILTTGSGSDTIYGGGNAEKFYGMQGADSLVGGAGNDTLYGDSSDSLPSSAGDILHGGDGDDVLYGGGGSDSLYGESGSDKLYDYLLGSNDGVTDLLDGGTTGTNDDTLGGADTGDTKLNFEH